MIRLLRSLILGIIVTGCIVLASCGQSRWFPTDPRVATPDTSNFTIDDSWSIGIGTTVTAASMAMRCR